MADPTQGKMDDPMMLEYMSQHDDTPKMPLLDWLQERYDNCIRIAAQKTGDDQRGWWDDAYYFRLAIKMLQDPEQNPRLKRYIRNLRARRGGQNGRD